MVDYSLEENDSSKEAGTYGLMRVSELQDGFLGCHGMLGEMGKEEEVRSDPRKRGGYADPALPRCHSDRANHLAGRSDGLERTWRISALAPGKNASCHLHERLDAQRRRALTYAVAFTMQGPSKSVMEPCA